MPELGVTPPPSSPDWTVQVADRIEAVVETVRDKTTVPATKVARILVYGLVAGGLLAVALVLLAIALFRLHGYWPFHPEGRKVYVTYAALAAIFLASGAFLWRMRTPKVKR
jgi:hypothetical protein